MKSPETTTNVPEMGVRQVIAAFDAVLTEVPRTEEERERRAELVVTLRSVLGRLGIDGENLVRYGMSFRAALGVYRAMISPDDDELTTMVDSPRWRQLLHVPTPSVPVSESNESDAETMSRAILRVPHQLEMWVANARLDEILRYVPPTDDEWAAWSLLPRDSEEVTDAYTWLWQRSATETLSRWSLAALHLEYKWQNSHQVDLFSERALSARGPETSLLNAEIAKRAVEPQFQEQIEADRLFWDLQETAVDYLTKRKYLEAVTLFEFHLRRNPNDARTLNNLGFCSIPLDPGRALHWLDRAESCGYPDTAISVYNQCCCLMQLNRAGEALDKAERYWQRQRGANAPTGYLWVWSDKGWMLAADANTELALIDLALAAAEEVGRTERAGKWGERREEIAHATSTLPPIESDTA